MEKEICGLGWLSNFYIDPDIQRKGWGKKFLGYLEDEVKEVSPYLGLEFWPEAYWAENFYRKNGFKEDPTVFKSKSTHTLVLIKKLRS